MAFLGVSKEKALQATRYIWSAIVLAVGFIAILISSPPHSADLSGDAGQPSNSGVAHADAPIIGK